MTEKANEIAQAKRGFVYEDEPEPVKQGRSLVVVIGINEYVHQQKLKNAVQDAIGLQQTLIDKLGFSAPIPPLLNEVATRGAIFSLIEDRLYEVVEENDSLIIFFAGHGQTRVRKVGNHTIETGYLIPVDAAQSWSDYVEIDPFLRSLSALPARHILVILDSCHSGFALGQAVNDYRGTENYEKALNSKISRRVITSARRDELALDNGPIPGHSLFTGTLIDGFNWGKADTDSNGLITSSELGLFIQQQVVKESKSKQTPDFGSFGVDDRGEMVISLRNQSFDALKARSFSALQRGELKALKEFLGQINNLNPSSPETLYLEYRQMIFEGRFREAILHIDKLLNFDLSKGILPLSSHDLKETKVQILENLNLLELSEITELLEIELVVGFRKDCLELAEKKIIEGKNIYQVTTNQLGLLRIKNPPHQLPLHVYMIKIDSDGRLKTGRLWEDKSLEDWQLQPQETRLSYTFIFNDNPGICERYLFSCVDPIRHFSESSSFGNVFQLEVDNAILIKESVRKQVIRYQIQ